MINNVVLVGRMTRDAELRYTPSNQAVATFSLAVNRNFKSQNGEREADFINCVAFGKTAEAIGNYVYKGQRLLVEGRIQTGSYTSKSGEKKFTTEISVNRAEFIEKRSETSTQGNSHAGSHNAPPVGFEQMGTEVKDPQWMEQEEIPF